MHRIDREHVHEILHDYKRECFQMEHSDDAHHEIEKVRERMVEDILAQNFHYHFHKPITPERAEVFGMIENYVREAVLPPVVKKLTERIVLLERRQAAGIKCLERILNLIAESG